MNDLKVIDHLFERLSVIYGTAWTRSLGGAPIADVKSNWLHYLQPWMKSRDTMKAIGYALDNLPDSVPNVIEFKNLCMKAPSVQQDQLLPPRPDPKMVALIAEGIREKVSKTEPKDYKQWARNILAQPEGKTRAQLDMAKRALAEV